MKKMRPYFSMLMLALLLFPIADKSVHEYAHLNEDHCEIKSLHFCEAEHQCTVCDYVFSSSSTPPKTQDQLTIFANKSIDFESILVFNTIISPKFSLSLRGPPVC